MTRFDVAADFAASTAGHRLTVLHADGVYRHLRCRQPGTSIWGWDITTWPGHLAVSGDLGDFTFCREPDMLDFFTGPVDAGYWLEKCVAWPRYSHPGGVVSMRRIEQHLDDIDIDEGVRDELNRLDGTHSVNEAVRLLMEHAHADAWDWGITEPDVHAVRALHAISWTVKHWRESQP